MLKRKKQDAAAEVTAVEEVVVAPTSEETGKKNKKKATKAEKPKKEKKAKKEKEPKAEKPKKAKKEKKSKKGNKSEKVTKKATIFGSPIRNLIVCALMAIAVGAAFLAEPKMVYTYCGYAIGGLIGLVGLVYILIYFLRKPVSGVYRSEFVLGMVALLAGAYVAVGGLLSGSSTLSTLSFATIIRILGILMAAGGLLKLQYTLDIARMKYSKWWIALILSVLGIALGVITTMGLTYSLGATVGMSGMTMLGIAFCVNGALDLGVMIVVAVRNHKANKAAALAEAEAIVAAAKQEEAADFFPEEDTSAEEEGAPVEEVSSQPITPEPEVKPEPEPIAQPEPEPEPEPEPQPEPEPVVEAEPEPEVFEPELPEPALATPADEN